jgi:hypothetical protein
MRLFLGLAVALAAAGPALAHDPGLSELEVVVGNGRVEASWWIDEADLAGAEPPAFGAMTAQLDGATAAPTDAFAHSSWDGHRRLRLVWSGRPRTELRLTAALLDRLPLGHRVFLRILDGADRVAAETLLSARTPSFTQSLDAGPAAVDE